MLVGVVGKTIRSILGSTRIYFGIITLQVSKKISKGIGVLTKLCHYTNIHTLTQLYYTLFFSFLTYGLVVWGNTYNSLFKPLITSQRKAVRSMTYSNKFS